MRYSIFWVASIAIVAGCVTAPNLERQLSTFENMDESRVVAQLGPPDGVDVDDLGRRVLVYGSRGIDSYPDCLANFVLDEHGNVSEWNWNGRHCQTFASETFGSP